MRKSVNRTASMGRAVKSQPTQRITNADFKDCRKSSKNWRRCPFPPSPPLPVPRHCSATSQVLRSCPTSHVRSSSAYVLHLPDTVCTSLLCRQTWDLPVPVQDGSVHAWGLRLRRVPARLALAAHPVLPSAYFESVGTLKYLLLTQQGRFSQLNTQPAHSSVNASSPSLRVAMHDSRPLWLATPSAYETFTHTILAGFTGAPKSPPIGAFSADEPHSGKRL